MDNVYWKGVKVRGCCRTKVSGKRTNFWRTICRQPFCLIETCINPSLCIGNWWSRFWGEGLLVAAAVQGLSGKVALVTGCRYRTALDLISIWPTLETLHNLVEPGSRWRCSPPWAVMAPRVLRTRTPDRQEVTLSHHKHLLLPWV